MVVSEGVLKENLDGFKKEYGIEKSGMRKSVTERTGNWYQV